MKKIISFCLYGQSPIYEIGALRNSELAKEIYPEWICRFYVSEEVSKEIKDKLLQNGSEVIEFKTQTGMNPMLTRLLVFSDPDVEIWISRDCDSRLNHREREAVKEWENSDKIFHIIRDSHNHYYPILGGTFGVKNKRMKESFQNIPAIDLFFSGGDDQKFLDLNFWSFFKTSLLCHDTWSHNSPKLDSLVDPPGEEISWKEAYRVGLVNYLIDEKNKIFSHLFNLPSQTNKDFPAHEPLKFGVFVGQKIDENDKVVPGRDSRWEYQIRGLEYPF